MSGALDCTVASVEPPPGGREEIPCNARPTPVQTHAAGAAIRNEHEGRRVCLTGRDNDDVWDDEAYGDGWRISALRSDLL